MFASYIELPLGGGHFLFSFLEWRREINDVLVLLIYFVFQCFILRLQFKSNNIQLTELKSLWK